MPWPKGTPHSEEMKAKRLASFMLNGKKLKKPVATDKSGTLLWRCTTCKDTLSAASFYANKRRANGLTSQCKKCHCATTIRTRDKDNSCDANRAYMRRARARDPEKFRVRDRQRKPADPIKTAARAQLNAAVRNGNVKRPSICPRCERTARVTGHHEDYSKPLNVEWLCYECHGLEHRQ